MNGLINSGCRPWGVGFARGVLSANAHQLTNNRKKNDTDYYGDLRWLRNLRCDKITKKLTINKTIMKANEFSKTLDNGLANVVTEVGNVEGLAKDFRKYGIRDVFTYGAWCEHNFEKNLREDYERKTTFTSDLSFAETRVPVEGIKAVADTIKNAAKSWRNDIEYFAELIIAVNMKAWEHHARGMWTNMEDILKRNMNDAIARYTKLYQNGHCTSEELQRLIAWEKKNYESGGKLYAERLAKALTPKPEWFK